jgi:hypothetical protein
MNEIKEDSKIFRAWKDFNKVSIKKVPDAETFQKLISLSPKLRAWYCSWSFDNSAFTQMPQSFRDAGITPQQWSELSANLPKINAIRKKASSEIEAKANDFTTFVSNKELEVKEQLEKLETPYVKILKVNVTCLPIDDQLEILSKPENEREALEKSLLEKLRTKLFADLKANKFVDPFVFGDFKDLLTT